VFRKSELLSVALIVNALAAGLWATAASAAPPPGGSSFTPPTDVEPNNTFGQRSVITGSTAVEWQKSFTGRLGKTDARVPDTLMDFFAFGNDLPNGINDDGGDFIGYGGSGLFFQTSTGPIRIDVTGSGNDAFSSGFNHGERGAFDVYIRFYAGTFISETVLHGEFVTGDEVFSFTNIALAPGTVDFDIIVNPLADEEGDVDFYEMNGLRPNADYRLTIIGGVNSRILPRRPLDTVMAQFTAAGVQTSNFNDDIGAVPPNNYNPRSVLTITSDNSGRLFFAISGYDDSDFNGADNSGPFPLERHKETGQYTFHIKHQCIGRPDINLDGVVDGSDLAILLVNWGATCN